MIETNRITSKENLPSTISRQLANPNTIKIIIIIIIVLNSSSSSNFSSASRPNNFVLLCNKR